MLTDEDRTYLEALDKAIWDRPEKFPIPGKSNYASEKRDLTDEEREKVITIFENCREDLVFEPGSGVFGFGVSVSVYLPPPFPDAPVTRLITITGRHVFGGKEREKRSETYRFVERFTHTDVNRGLRKFSGFKEPLRSMAYYDY